MFFSQNRFPLLRNMLASLFEHVLVAKPVPTFAEHALLPDLPLQLSRQTMHQAAAQRRDGLAVAVRAGAAAQAGADATGVQAVDDEPIEAAVGGKRFGVFSHQA